MAKRKGMTKKFVEEGVLGLANDHQKTEKDFKEKDTAISEKIGILSGSINPEDRIGPIDKFLSKIELLYMCAKDYWNDVYSDMPWTTIAAIVFALLYFVNPFDLIPDFIPVIGYVDDATVLYFVWAAIKRDLKEYAIWKELDLEEYF